MPLPMTPTVFTVLTRSGRRIEQVSLYDFHQGRTLHEEQVGIEGDRKFADGMDGVRSIHSGAVHALDELGSNTIRNQHLCAPSRLLPVVDDLVRITPIAGEHQFVLHDSGSVGAGWKRA